MGRLGGSDALRGRARANHAATLPDTAQIYRPGVGTPTPDFGSSASLTLLDTVSANYWTVTAGEAIVLERMDVRASDTVTLPALTDITERDQIVYTVTETGRIHHFEVSAVYDRSRPHTLKVACIEYKFDQ